MEKKSLFELTHALVNANPSTTFEIEGEKLEYSAMEKAFRAEMNKLSGTPALYRANKNTIFELIETVLDEVTPKKVLEQFGSFAEIKTFSQGDKPIFITKITEASKKRAKQFVTRVGLAGRYEVFRLEGSSVEVKTSAIGGAARIGWEEFLDGRVDFADLTAVLYEALDEAIYKEIQKALIATIKDMPAANKKTDTGFVEKKMDDLLAVIDSYGPATIYCTFEFAATMLPNKDWASDGMKDQLWQNGYFTTYKRHNVIVLPQSYEEDEDGNANAKKVIDPKYAWVMPSGSTKPVKIAFEGQTCVDEAKNLDWSREIQVYKKFGVATLVTNNIGVYIQTGLTM